MTDLLTRLRRKGLAVLPILAGALLLSLVLSGLFLLFQWWGPEAWNERLRWLADGDFASRKALLKEYFAGFGDRAAWVFLGVQFLQVLIAPIPGQVTGLLGGFLFGFWPGLGLTMAGLLVGSVTVMGLTRLAGNWLVRRMVPSEIMEKFDFLLAKGRVFDFFMIYLLPALPDDAVCFIAGLTRLSLWRLTLACLLGRLPGMAVLTFAGSSLDADLELAQRVFGAAMLVAMVIWLYDDKIEAWVRRRA
ncbi:MAG: TVP38/TMEM64 family protein [Magnetococcales bacterium]|nr:TVP38/TMEM64 family protein [Magnetococcales bacterium]